MTETNRRPLGLTALHAAPGARRPGSWSDHGCGSCPRCAGATRGQITRSEVPISWWNSRAVAFLGRGIALPEEAPRTRSEPHPSTHLHSTDCALVLSGPNGYDVNLGSRFRLRRIVMTSFGPAASRLKGVSNSCGQNSHNEALLHDSMEQLHVTKARPHSACADPIGADRRLRSSGIGYGDRNTWNDGNATWHTACHECSSCRHGQRPDDRCRSRCEDSRCQIYDVQTACAGRRAQHPRSRVDSSASVKSDLDEVLHNAARQDQPSDRVNDRASTP